MKENGFEYVDLGLPSNTMWATCNVGATKPEDSGLLFQFGQVNGYKYGDENHKFKKLKNNNKDNARGFKSKTATGIAYDVGSTLGLKDDAVHVNMGGKWRMPTYSCDYDADLEEYEFGGDWGELLNNTNQTVVTINNIKGMLFTSNINGNTLFIPFMDGYWDGDKYIQCVEDAVIWSSAVDCSNYNFANNFYCNSNEYFSINFDFRYCAMAVRGVFKK